MVVRHEAITLREAVAARKTRIPNPEASVVAIHLFHYVFQRSSEKDRNRYNVRMRPCTIQR
jgi:hypothetical protein